MFNTHCKIKTFIKRFNVTTTKEFFYFHITISIFNKLTLKIIVFYWDFQKVLHHFKLISNKPNKYSYNHQTDVVSNNVF